jgi:hypothetical protein
MRSLLKRHYDRLLLSLVTVALVTSLGWFWCAQWDVRRIRGLPVAIRSSTLDYQSEVLPVPDAHYEPWPKPAVQSAGGGWLYELFTPPSVFYNQRSESFTVTPPSDAIETNSSFNLELLAVKRELYRLQLAGYFGGPGAYTVAFTSPGKSAVLLAREGEEIEGFGIRLKHFSVGSVLLEHRDNWPVNEVAAFADLIDERAGITVTLDSRWPTYTDAPVATVKIASETGASRQAHEGDEFSDSGSIYRIEHIRFDPAEVVVTRRRLGVSTVDTGTLRPVAGQPKLYDRHADDSKYFSSRPATGLATNAK